MPKHRNARLIGLLLTAGLVAASALLQEHFRFALPDRSLTSARSPSRRALRTQRTLATLEQQNLVPHRAPVVINEIMTANHDALLDEERQPHDWLELFNRSSRPVSLLGWSLLDGRDSSKRWLLPDLTLAPGEFLVVFASGKDRVGSAITRKLAVLLNAQAEKELNLDGARPAEPPLEELKKRPRYQRLTTTLAVPKSGRYSLWIKLRGYSDPLNEITLSVDGAAPISLVLERTSRYRHVRVANSEHAKPEWELTESEHRVDIRSTRGEVEIDRLSWARAAAVGEDPYALHLHTSFRLKTAGETVILLDAVGHIQDYVTPPVRDSAGSYQRQTDGGKNFVTAAPTPKGGRPILPGPDLSAYPSVSETPLRIEIATMPGSDELRFTRDSSLPNAQSALWEHPLEIKEPGVLRVRGFAKGRPATAVVTRQFWIGAAPPDPVVMLAIDPYALKDPESGILPNNAWRGRVWERAAHALVFDRRGIALDGPVGLRTHAGNGKDRGAGTSFRVYCRPAFGPERLTRDIFEPALGSTPSKFIIDAGGASWVDKLVFDLVRAGGGFAPRAAIGPVFLNGEHYNVATFIEPVDADFLRSRWGHTDFDLIKGKPFEVKRGSLARFQKFAQRLSTTQWSSADLSTEVDFPGLIALHFAMVFAEASEGGLHHKDAVQGYLAFDQNRTPPLLRAIAWDLDHSFRYPAYDTLSTQSIVLSGYKYTTRFLPALLVQKLLKQDAAFRSAYLEHAGRMLGETYRPKRWLAKIDRLQRLHETYARFAYKGPLSLASEKNWKGSVSWKRAQFEKAREFFRERPKHVQKFLRAVGPQPKRARKATEMRGRSSALVKNVGS